MTNHFYHDEKLDETSKFEAITFKLSEIKRHLVKRN